MEKKFKSGFVTIIGRPNVGKSTLMNQFIGRKISIVSKRPQTTRNTIQSILTGEDFQVIFIDTPGLHRPRNKLGEYMVKVAEDTLNEIDLILYIVEPDVKIGEGDLEIIEKLKKVKKPIILVINKIDTVSKERILESIASFKEKNEWSEIVPISALNGENIDKLLELILKYLPEGPKYFPDDMITDQPERFIVAELIREKMLELLEDEVPHGIAVDIESFKEREDKPIIDISAIIYCEKESHKGIIIGKNGRMLKQIGERARIDIENLLGTKVYLQLWVKVKRDWRNISGYLKMFGYK